MLKTFKLGLLTIFKFVIIVGIILGIMYIALLNDIFYWIIQIILIICVIYSIGKAKLRK